MKKVGIITLYKNNLNYGGMLQAYALQKTVQNLIGEENECVQISYELSSTPFKDKLIHGLQYRSFLENLSICLSQLKKRGSKEKNSSSEAERKIAFEKFEESIPHTQKIYTYKSIEECKDSFTHLISGSDQVWNGGVDLESFCLGFASPYTKKFSYAASSASTKFGKWQDEIFERNLHSFEAISVREKSVAPYFEVISGKVLDPVFFLSAPKWENIAVNPLLSSPSVFCYLLGDNEKQLEKARILAIENHCKLVSFPDLCGFDDNDCYSGDIQIHGAGPKEFLGLIKNAECIITDSFHATAFSIIFNKPFLAFPRFKNQKGKSNNHRVVDIMNDFNLSEWYNIEGNVIPRIDYDNANRIMQVNVKKSYDFLRFALEDAT